MHVVSSVVRRGQEMFCGCSRFRFGVRVIEWFSVECRKNQNQSNYSSQSQ